MSNLIKRWWAWSTGPGKRRKIIGFGIPALVAVMLLLALTPDPPEEPDPFASPTASASQTQGPFPTATTADTSSSEVDVTPTPEALSGDVPLEPSPPASSVADDGDLVASEPTAGDGGAVGQDGRERSMVSRVIDGDTVELADGRRLRYIGIDTAETVAPDQPVECYGPEASARNAELVLGQVVWLETDVNDTDRYGRLLRYVYLEDGRMVNEVLVEEGFAKSVAYRPDTKHQALLDAAESRARAGGLGLWSACPGEPEPSPTPAAVATAPPAVQGECPLGCEVPPPGCLIKGNISTEHIYHVPGQQHYEETKISPERGERWFCTEAEAVANGWRKALR